MPQSLIPGAASANVSATFTPHASQVQGDTTAASEKPCSSTNDLASTGQEVIQGQSSNDVLVLLQDMHRTQNVILAVLERVLTRLPLP
jgi:hypothetical protein